MDRRRVLGHGRRRPSPTTLTISGPNVKVIVGGGTVNLEGTTTWAGNTADNNNAIQFWNGATINNHGTFNDANAFASFIEHNVGGPHNFNNVGTYNKLSNTITTVDLGVAFNNSGVVNVNAGSFRPSGGTSTGTFNIAAGAVLDFKNGNNVLNGVTTQGLGTLAISSDLVGADALVTINGGTHTTPFAFSGSVLSGDAHTFQGPVTWTGGTISGAGTTTFAHDVTISGANTKAVADARVLNLDGTTTWSGNTAANNNSIQFSNGATINNHGTFNDANAVRVVHRAQRRRPAQLQQPRHLQQAGEHGDDGRFRRRLQQLRNAQHRRRDDALLQRHAGPDRHGEGGERRDLPARRQQHDGHADRPPARSTSALNTLTISADYDNANFGSGNAFNRRANVVTTGAGNRLIAAGDANQGISGAGVVNGNTATPTLMIGNVHVGSTTYTYNIANTGSDRAGAARRDPDERQRRQHHRPAAVGQRRHRRQLGAARDRRLARARRRRHGRRGRLARAADRPVGRDRQQLRQHAQPGRDVRPRARTPRRIASPRPTRSAPIAFGNVHVGDAVSQALTIRNLAPNDGFSEKLNASFGSANDPRITFARQRQPARRRRRATRAAWSSA